ncbi:MAG: SRPBCC domain-containing protein [Thermoplasmata archaeon]
MDKVIYQSVLLKCNPQKAFEMFTLNEHLEKWLTQVADVEPKIGGKYELFWNPEDKENDSTIGCKILVIQPGKFLSFEWKGPKQFKHFMNEARPLTNVAVSFFPCAEGTEVHVLHTGWRETPEWEEARQWFVQSWEMVLSELEKCVNKDDSL